MILFCGDYKSRATTTPCYFHKKALKNQVNKIRVNNEKKGSDLP